MSAVAGLFGLTRLAAFTAMLGARREVDAFTAATLLGSWAACVAEAAADACIAALESFEITAPQRGQKGTEHATSE
jgi:hypothetical protein